ncbi:tetratricopeptide repeat protein [Pseudomonas shahriarae]|nr:tetratricopeptide repeat protein [Pseudomonas shahriarae]
MSAELDVVLDEKLKEYCRFGDMLAEQGSYEKAMAQYNSAWRSVPEPKNNWEASTWILAAIADACFLSGYKGSGRDALQYAMTCPNGIGNPFLHLRLGQVYLDEGQENSAADELMRAYMGAGPEIFANESSHYLNFLKTRAKL